MQLHEISQHNTTVWVADKAKSDFQVDWFDRVGEDNSQVPREWHSGRQSVTKFNVDGQSYVRRHYCRGGVPAQITKDKFIYKGLTVCRPYQEMKLLTDMRQLKLPVPEPIAARCVVKGIFYTADIIMREIENTNTLAHKVSERKLKDEDWMRIGKVIRQFHSAGIQHVDLNANNILLNNEGEIFLIDFDRCVQKGFAEKWGKAGLDRLQRSLVKFKRANQNLFFEQKDFDLLLAGYRG